MMRLGSCLIFPLPGRAAGTGIGGFHLHSGQKSTGFVEVPAWVCRHQCTCDRSYGRELPAPNCARSPHTDNCVSSVPLAIGYTRGSFPDVVWFAGIILSTLLNIVASFLQEGLFTSNATNSVDQKGVGGYPHKANGTQSNTFLRRLLAPFIEKLRPPDTTTTELRTLDKDLHPFPTDEHPSSDLRRNVRDMVFAFRPQRRSS